jgi:DNA-binding NtrC family response regulator
MGSDRGDVVGWNAVDEPQGTRLAAFEQPLRVLVVDPDHDARALVRDALEGHAQVIGRTSSRRARETLRVARFDVLVLDLILSGTRGIQFLDHLPADQRPERVVIITGWRDGWSAARQRGVDAMLRKPCTSDAVRAAVLGTSRDTRPPSELAGAPHARLPRPPANGTHADPESR